MTNQENFCVDRIYGRRRFETFHKFSNSKYFRKHDINNNTAKVRRTPPVNDNDDVETVQTADADTLVPAEILENQPVASQQLEQDYPSDPNETDVSWTLQSVHRIITVQRNIFLNLSPFKYRESFKINS